MARKKQINGLCETTYTYKRDGLVRGKVKILSDNIGPVSVALPAAKRAAMRWIQTAKSPAKAFRVEELYCGGRVVAYGVFRKGQLRYEAGILDY